MATLRKRGKTSWQAIIRKKGHGTISKAFKTKALAERWARETEITLETGTFVSDHRAQETPFELVIEKYIKEVLPAQKSVTQTTSKARLIAKNLGHHMVAVLTPELLASYRDQRLEKVSPQTIRKELLLIKKILRIAQKEWGIHLPRGNPITDITVPSQPKGRDRRLQAGEEELLLSHAIEYGGYIEQIIIFAIETAARRGEISKLRWEHVDLKKRTATFYDTKNTEDRTIPLSTKAMEVLKNFDREKKGHVFPVRADSITQAFERVRKKAEIEDLRFHDLRHEATSRLFEKGLSIMEVSSITGHKDLAMLRGYTHLRAEDLVSKLG